MKHTILDEMANELTAAAMDMQRSHARLFDAVTKAYGENSPEALRINERFAEYEKELAPILGASILQAACFRDGIAVQ